MLAGRRPASVLALARAGTRRRPRRVARAGYPRERLHFVEGRVEETLPGHAPDRIALLRLDTDWYESTRHELVHLYPRLAPGGVLIIDDYGWWRGAAQGHRRVLRRLIRRRRCWCGWTTAVAGSP